MSNLLYNRSMQQRSWPLPGARRCWFECTAETTAARLNDLEDGKGNLSRWFEWTVEYHGWFKWYVVPREI